MTIDDPTRLGALEAAAAIARGELTSVALTQACLDRIRSREDVGAWVVVHADRALAEAAARDAESPRSPLHGVPFGVKDIQMPCTPERIWKAIHDQGAGGDEPTVGDAAPHFDEKDVADRTDGAGA